MFNYTFIFTKVVEIHYQNVKRCRNTLYSQYNVGMGLKSIRNIADRYEGNMHYEYDEEKRAFTMTVMIRRPGGGIINDDQKVETH